MRSTGFEALGYAFSLEESDAPSCSEALAALGPLRVDRPGEVPTYAFRSASGDAVRVLRDGVVLEELDGTRQAVDWLLWHVNQAVAAAGDAFVLLHAAAVEIGGGAVLLPGASGAGKSTLCAALVLTGAGYLTDELTALAPDDVAVVPYPKSLALDGWSIAALAALGMEQPTTTAGASAHVPPEAIRPAATARPCPPSMIVFPHFEAGAGSDLVELSAADALVEVLSHSVNLAVHGGRALTLLAGVVERVPCWRLTYSDLGGATELVWSHASSVRPARTRHRLGASR
ncbi:MAG TPA: hypothetical protein VMU09_04710 [Acidimicrobiales bacterium]|nr:hypothetical protein [Acidimicrobiales bacterium]